jgi:hypothetical protein
MSACHLTCIHGVNVGKAAVSPELVLKTTRTVCKLRHISHETSKTTVTTLINAHAFALLLTPKSSLHCKSSPCSCDARHWKLFRTSLGTFPGAHKGLHGLAKLPMLMLRHPLVALFTKDEIWGVTLACAQKNDVR